MVNVCRYPGCSIRTQTKQGLELHESLCHGMVYNRMMQTMFMQVRAQDGASHVQMLMVDQIAFMQDELSINAMLAM